MTDCQVCICHQLVQETSQDYTSILIKTGYINYHLLTHLSTTNIFFAAESNNNENGDTSSKQDTLPSNLHAPGMSMVS